MISEAIRRFLLAAIAAENISIRNPILYFGLGGLEW